MAGLSDYLEDKILQHLLRDGSWTKPSAIYVALHTSDPLDTGLGSEVSGGSYARIQHGPSDATWTDPDASGISVNVGAVTFDSPSASWGTVTHVALWDAVTAGNLLASGELAVAKTVNEDDAPPTFEDGTLTVVAA